MRLSSSLLCQVITHPERVELFGGRQWNHLLAQAELGRLHGWLGVYLHRSGVRVPTRVASHFENSARMIEQQQRDLAFELNRLGTVLAPYRPVLLKGGAYFALGLPHARQRQIGDIDLLVQHSQLAEVERLLNRHGWHNQHYDRYDQLYYRRWMQELPAFVHFERGTVLDLHHNIQPLTSRYPVDAERLFEAAEPLASSPFAVLSPCDRIVHSAAHLLLNGDADTALRDLIDMVELINQLSRHPDWYLTLNARAQELALERPLQWAFALTRQLLPTLLKVEVPKQPVSSAILAVLDYAFCPEHSSCDGMMSRLCRQGFYWRGHYLRMPVRLLIPHLTHKAVVNLSPQRS